MPIQGYTDWQRITNQESPPLFTDTTARTGLFTFPIFYVGHWRYLAGRMLVSGVACEVRFFWYADSPQLELLGGQSFVLDPAISDVNFGSAIQLHLLNRGAWCLIQINPDGGGTWTPVFRLSGSNRDYPLQALPARSRLFNATITVGAGATVNSAPFLYYAGPALMSVDTNAQLLRVRIRGFTTPTATWLVSNHNVPAATETNVPVIVPMGAWDVQVFNAAGVADTVSVRVTAGLTGSN